MLLMLSYRFFPLVENLPIFPLPLVRNTRAKIQSRRRRGVLSRAKLSDGVAVARVGETSSSIELSIRHHRLPSIRMYEPETKKWKPAKKDSQDDRKAFIGFIPIQRCQPCCEDDSVCPENQRFDSAHTSLHTMVGSRW